MTNVWDQEEKVREAALEDDLRPVVYAILRCLQRMDAHDGYPGDSDLLAYISQARVRLAAPTALPKVDTTPRTVDTLTQQTAEAPTPEKQAIQKNARKIQEAQAAQEREEAIALGRAAMRSLQAKPAPEGDFVEAEPEKATA